MIILRYSFKEMRKENIQITLLPSVASNYNAKTLQYDSCSDIHVLQKSILWYKFYQKGSILFLVGPVFDFNFQVEWLSGFAQK